MKNDKTLVAFRRCRSGQVVAVFPREMARHRDAPAMGRECCVGSYAIPDGHSAAQWGWIVDSTRPATQAEYATLKRNMETCYDYSLDVTHRLPRLR